MGLVVVGISRVNSGEVNGVLTRVVDLVLGGSEEFRSSTGIIGCSTAVELNILYRIAGDGLVDTYTYLGAKSTEFECNRLLVIGLLYCHKFRDVAVFQIGCSTLERVSINQTCSRRCGSFCLNLGHEHFTSGGSTFIDSSLRACRPSNEVILVLTVVPVFDGLTGDTVVSSVLDGCLAYILPVVGVRCRCTSCVLVVLNSIVVEYSATRSASCCTLVAKYYKLVTELVGCFFTHEIRTCHAFVQGAEHDGLIFGWIGVGHLVNN